jgi:Ca-activated chloride channel family protein
LVQAQQAHAAKQAAPQDAAQQPSADPGKAIEDLREALRLRPQWTEAAHNLDLALRLREQNKKDQNQKQDPKNKPDPQNQDKKDPQPKSQDPQSNPQSSPEPQPQTGMNQQDAQRLLDGAQAQEAAKMRAKKQKNQRKNDGPDW